MGLKYQQNSNVVENYSADTSRNLKIKSLNFEWCKNQNVNTSCDFKIKLSECQCSKNQK